MRWTSLLASASLLALFVPGDSDAQWGGGFLAKTHSGSGPVGSCPQGSAFTDGCAAAPVASIPLPTALNGYAARPPWNVAGVDYGVGVPTGTTLTDANTATMPAGCSRASFVITCSSGTPTLNALDFTGHNGMTLNVTGGSVTLTNSKFRVGTNNVNNQLGAMITVDGTSNLTALHNEFDGNNVAVVSQFDAAMFMTNSGTTDMEWNWFHDAGGDTIDANGGTNRNEIIRFNVFSNNGNHTTVNVNGEQGHADTIQHDMDSGGSVASADWGFNTIYTNFDTTTEQGGLGTFVYQNGFSASSPNNGHNVSLHNNTVLDLGSCLVGYSGNFVMGYGANAFDTNGRLANNYFDPRGADCYTGPWTPDFPFLPNHTYAGYYYASPMAITGNVDMFHGATITAWPTSSQGYAAVPDAAAYTPSISDIWSPTTAVPSSGTVSLGGTVTITVHMDAPYTVTGAPRLTLNSGGTANYFSGSGTNSLVFVYTVASGNSTSNLAITGVNLNGGTIKDPFGNAAILTTSGGLSISIATTFTGLAINGSGGGPTLAFSTLNGGAASSTTPISGTYTVSAPTGLTGATFGGGCSGSATITGFSASGGNWNATTTTPGSACTGTETVTGTGANTATATYPSTATFTSGGVCPQGNGFPSDGCTAAQSTGSLQHANLFTTYTGTNFSAHRPPWNVAGVDYPVGYTGTLTDAATATLPACASRTGSGSGPFAVTVSGAGCTLSHLDFSTHNGICVTVTASGTTTLDNDKFGVGTNCPLSIGGAISINTAGTVNIQYSHIDGTPSTALYQGLIQINTAGPHLNVTYTAFTNNGQADIQSQAASTIVSRYNYAEGLGTGGLAHGDYVIGFSPSGASSQDISWNVIYAGPNSSSTTDCYIASTAGSSGSMTSFCNNNVLLGPPDVSNGFLVHYSLDGTAVHTEVNNNYMGLLQSYGYFTSDGNASGTGTTQCTGNKDMATGAAATSDSGNSNTWINGTQCN